MRIPSGVTDKYVCSKCSEVKGAECFGVDNHQARGRKYTCKECTNEKRRGSYKKENRKYHLKSKYGITPEKYAAMIEDQKGLCAICEQVGERRSGGARAEPALALYVDHDHVSNEVRGLLCHKCNVAVGLMCDGPMRLEKAAKYIRGIPCALKVA